MGSKGRRVSGLGNLFEHTSKGFLSAGNMVIKEQERELLVELVNDRGSLVVIKVRVPKLGLELVESAVEVTVLCASGL